MCQFDKCRVLILYAVTCYFLSRAVSTAADPSPPVVFDIGVTKYRDSCEFYQGEPICVRAGIRRESKGDEKEKGLLMIGTRSLPWDRSLAFAMYRLEEDSTQITNKTTHGKLLLNNIHFEQLEPRSEKYELRTNEVLRSFWAISPDITSNLPAGRYLMQALFDTTNISETHPEMLHIKLMSSEMPVVLSERPRGGRAEVDILEAQARYLELRQKYDEAIALLEQVERLDPAKQEVHCRMGRAYELKGDRQAATKEYRSYVEWARKQPRTGKNDFHDHAEVIEGMIRALDARSKNVKENKP